MQIAEKGRNYVCSQLVRYFFPDCINCGNGVDFLCGDASEMSIGDRWQALVFGIAPRIQFSRCHNTITQIFTEWTFERNLCIIFGWDAINAKLILVRGNIPLTDFLSCIALDHSREICWVRQAPAGVFLWGQSWSWTGSWNLEIRFPISYIKQIQVPQPFMSSIAWRDPCCGTVDRAGGQILIWLLVSLVKPAEDRRMSAVISVVPLFQSNFLYISYLQHFYLLVLI